MNVEIEKMLKNQGECETCTSQDIVPYPVDQKNKVAYTA